MSDKPAQCPRRGRSRAPAEALSPNTFFNDEESRLLSSLGLGDLASSHGTSAANPTAPLVNQAADAQGLSHAKPLPVREEISDLSSFATAGRERHTSGSSSTEQILCGERDRGTFGDADIHSFLESIYTPIELNQEIASPSLGKNCVDICLRGYLISHNRWAPHQELDARPVTIALFLHYHVHAHFTATRERQAIYNRRCTPILAQSRRPRFAYCCLHGASFPSRHFEIARAGMRAPRVCVCGARNRRFSSSCHVSSHGSHRYSEGHDCPCGATD
jgi:hypothetical protein